MQRACLVAAAAAAVAAAPTIAPVPTIPLSGITNGSVAIPQILLGTGGGNGGFDVLAWIEAGGAGFDTAQTYCYFTSPKRDGVPAAACSQVAIANALSVAGVDPRSYFIISKIEPEDFGALDVWSGFGRAFDRGILQEMSTPVLDVIMFHQAGRGESAGNVRPACFNASAAGPAGPGAYAACRLATFSAMLELVRRGAVRAAAVSNWQVRDLQQAFDATGAFPSALEVEVHPWWHEDALLDFCLANNITIIAYAPVGLATAEHLADPAVAAVAAAHPGMTPAQVLLRWALQRTRGVVIPRSANSTHMKENLGIFTTTMALTDAEMARLAALPQKKIFNVYCQPWC
jgi:diketogulonate reductase-like aldo/keto reductase